MTKFEYKEPEFKVVNTSMQDVLTASDGITNPGVFETGSESFDDPYTGA